MGRLIDGEWHESDFDPKHDDDGRFQRAASKFRHWVKRGDATHPAEPSRYHLYVSWACPWAHRTLIYRGLLGLADDIGISVSRAEMLGQGWEFDEDPVNGISALYQLYQKADPGFTGRVTVPVLWDKQAETIVSNESSEIIRMFDEELAPGEPGLRPEPLREEIDALNDRIYHTVNNGVYKAGFARTQKAYDEAAGELFDTLDFLEERLQGKRWLVGEAMTEADIRLFPTLVRFDPVYFVHFKCAKKRIQDYPNLWAHTRRIYQLPEVRDTVHIEYLRRHYYYSHESINPHRIVPISPELDLDAPVD